jgi:hypothetical protein
MYDYYLGGGHNFAADREAAQQVIAAMPFTITGARTNRSWLRRTVRYLTGVGIRQFLDLGSGVPTVGNVHEIAQAAAPESRVVYVDVDGVAVVHAKHMLANNPLAASHCADLRDTERVLAEAATMLDLSQPVGLILAAVLHFVPDSDRPADIVAAYQDALGAGSYVALSHMSPTGRPADELKKFTTAYASTPNPVTLRTREEILPLFNGWQLVEPGLVTLPQWRPEDPAQPDDELFPGYAGAAAKP